jgi:oligoribonuclease NrnB/cAMP/cGMP phosphodiesterase (DHH superfamily)
MRYNYIIFHRGCIDGFSAFFVANYSGKLTKDVIIHPDVPFTKKIPNNIENKDILILDVAYNKNVLEEIIKVAKSVVFIDHHVSIKDDVKILYQKYKDKKNITIIYDNELCGATLTWKFLQPRQKIPLFLKYVEDQDTGRWLYPNTKPFIYALKTFYYLSTEGKSLNKWFRLLNKNEVERLIEIGQTIKKFNDHLIGVELPKHSIQRFPSKKIYDISIEKGFKIFKPDVFYKVVVYNGSKNTELANRALDELDCHFVIMWSLNLEKKQYVISLRSREVDVGSISKLFGGGGHKLASSFSFPMNNFRIEELFEGASIPRKLKKNY